jgi:hypothetical protein
MAIQYASYQPIKEKSFYETFLESRQLAIKRQQLKMQQDIQMDEYAASIMRDPNFTKDSPYNPYINQKLQETLADARTKYQTGELNAATFKSYVANNIGKINLWVQNADQLMKSIDEGVSYYKTKGADVTSIKSRAARMAFMKEDGTWRTGDEISQMMQENKFSNIVNDVVSSTPELAFHDTKAIDDWLSTVKTSKEKIRKRSGVVTGGQKGRAGTTTTVTGVADYYPMWQDVERDSDGVPSGVRQKLIPAEQLKSNDAVWLSAVAAVKQQKLATGDVDDNGDVKVNDYDVVNYVTNYANQKRPYNFTEEEEKQKTNITYRTTVKTGDESGVDYNIFNATFQGKLPEDRFFTGAGNTYTLRPEFTKKLKISEVAGYGGQNIPVYAKSISIDKANKSLTVTDQGNNSVTYTAGSPGYASFMTQIDMNNSWLQGAGSSQPELNPKRSGFKTNF